VRSDAAKKRWKQVKKDGVLEYNKYKRDLYFVIATYISLQTAKTMVLQKLNRAENIGTFIKTANGYRVTAPEGFVAIDHIGKALKLVDRLEFSRANFTANSKDWK
jgi:radical SAM superfamily enzyme